MIIQVFKHGSFAHLMRYAFARGPVIATNLEHAVSPALAALEMELEAAESVRCKKPAFHYMLCPDPRDRIDTHTWRTIIRTFLRAMDLDGYKYLATLHAPPDGCPGQRAPHVHLIVCRVRNGRAWNDSHDYRRLVLAAMIIERKFGLRRARRERLPRRIREWVERQQEIRIPANPFTSAADRGIPSAPSILNLNPLRGGYHAWEDD